MIKAFDDNAVLGIMCVIAFFLWILLFMWNCFFFNEARIHYQQLGGNRAAGKEFTKGAVQVSSPFRSSKSCRLLTIIENPLSKLLLKTKMSSNKLLWRTKMSSLTLQERTERKSNKLHTKTVKWLLVLL